MAKHTRPGVPARIGGKVALFEVIQAAQADGGADPALAPSARDAARDEPAGRDAAAIPRLRPAGVSATPVASPRSARASRAASDPTRPGGGSKPLLVTLSALAAVAVLGAVFAVGRLSGGDAARPAVAAAPPDPAVLDVPPGGNAPLVSPAVLNGDGRSLASPAVASSVGPLVAKPGVTPAVPVQTVRRTLGLNYVLIESYHPSEENRALATRDALTSHGINATIERDVPGWGKRLCVVGTLGFEHIRGNEKLRAYIEQINQVSDVVSKDRKIKTFDPVPLLWSGR